jgi:hypothetical protein
MSDKVFCDKCNTARDFKLTRRNETFVVRGLKVGAELLIPICKVCGNEVYDRESVIRNDYVVFTKYNSMIRDQKLDLPEKDLSHPDYDKYRKMMG